MTRSRALTDELSPHSPAQVIIASLRKAWLLKTFNLYGDAGPALVKKLSLYIRDCPLTEALAEAHVYDLGFMMDSGHATSLTTAAQKRLFQESRDLNAGSGLFLPFDTTLFMQRRHDGRVTDAQGVPLDNVDNIHSYLMDQTPSHIVMNSFLYSVRLAKWVWCSELKIPRFSETLCDLAGYEASQPDATKVAHGYRQEALTMLGLLNRKDDVVVVEPADWTLDTSGKPLKAFQKPNPSVSIVKVNTNRVLHPPPDVDDGSGASVRPHDRRSHLRRRGRKIIQECASKIHGGAPSPTIKVVKLEQPL